MQDVVAITGAIADHFAQVGWRLALLDLPHGVDRLEQRFPETTVHGANLANSAEARVAINKTLTEHGRTGALLNVAGSFSMQNAVEATPDDSRGSTRNQSPHPLQHHHRRPATHAERGFRVHPRHLSRTSREWWREDVGVRCSAGGSRWLPSLGPSARTPRGLYFV